MRNRKALATVAVALACWLAGTVAHAQAALGGVFGGWTQVCSALGTRVVPAQAPDGPPVAALDAECLSCAQLFAPILPDPERAEVSTHARVARAVLEPPRVSPRRDRDRSHGPRAPPGA